MPVPLYGMDLGKVAYILNLNEENQWIIKFVLKMLISDLEVVSYRVYASEY